MCLGVCGLLGGCAEMPAITGTPPQSFLPSRAPSQSFELGVLIAGWHSGIVLPAGEVGPLSPLVADRHTKYLSFGWGNRRFYMSAQPSSGDAVAALFRSPSALFVQSAAAPAGVSGDDARIHWVCVDREQLWRADSYIAESLSQPNGRPVELGPGPLPGSRFYATRDHYSAAHTCNTWTVAALQYARLPARASGVIFASQASRRIRALRACPAP